MLQILFCLICTRSETSPIFLLFFRHFYVKTHFQTLYEIHMSTNYTVFQNTKFYNMKFYFIFYCVSILNISNFLWYDAKTV